MDNISKNNEVKVDSELEAKSGSTLTQKLTAIIRVDCLDSDGNLKWSETITDGGDDQCQLLQKD